MTTTAVSDEQQLLAAFKGVIPKMDGRNYKGQHGKVGIVGGSNVYTGAPFFAALAAHKVGADMTFMLTHPEAVPTLRSFSPDMVVSSLLPWSPMQEGSLDVDKWLKRVTVLVVGPGLDISSHPDMMLATEHLIQKAVTHQLPIVVDGSGFDVLTRHPDTLSLIKGYAHAVLTPNISELGRLGRALDVTMEGPMGSTWQQHVPAIAAALDGPLLVSKGPSDVLAGVAAPSRLRQDTPLQMTHCSQPASLKRCGGQGDVLAGTIATLVSWQQQGAVEHVRMDGERLSSAHPYLAAGLAACTLVRAASRRAFDVAGRSMLAMDVITELHPAFIHLFDE